MHECYFRKRYFAKMEEAIEMRLKFLDLVEKCLKELNFVNLVRILQMLKHVDKGIEASHFKIMFTRY